MITLSVVSHGQGALVQDLLDDLERIASPLVSQIIITLNIAENWQPENHRMSQKILVLRNTLPQGFGANHNAAFQACAYPYFVVLNPDLRLPQDVLGTLLEHMEAEPALALVSPRILGPDGVLQDAVRALITPWQVLQRRMDWASLEQRADWLAGMFMLFRSSVFRQLNGFDARYFMYCEDFDICARLRLAGYAFRSIDSVTVVHDARRASLKSWRHLSWHISSLMRMWLSPAFWRYRRMLLNQPV